MQQTCRRTLSIHTPHISERKTMTTEFNELFKQYSGRAKYYGGKGAKTDKSACNRTATSVETAIRNFSLTLSDSELLSLKAAVTTLRRLSDDLDKIAPLADAIHRNELAKAAKERQERLEPIAAERWPTTDALTQESIDLIGFLKDPSAKTFIKARHKATYVHFPSTTVRQDEMLHSRVASGDKQFPEFRLVVAEFIEHLTNAMKESSRLFHFSATDAGWTAGLDDYEAWKESRVKTDAADLDRDHSPLNCYGRQH